MTNLKKIIGTNIRNERIARSITMEELADKLDISAAFIGLIERGQRGASVKNLLKISEIFSISIDSLTKERKRTSSRVSEKKVKDPLTLKSETIKSLLFDFTEPELDFIISIIRDVNQLKHVQTKTGNDLLEGNESTKEDDSDPDVQY